MNVIEINLRFRKEDFKEIYFRKNNGSWLFNEVTKWSAIYFLLFILGLLYYSFFYPSTDKNFVLPLIGLAFFIYDFSTKFLTYYKWRKSVIDFLDKQSQYATHKVLLTELHFSVEQDKDVSFEKFDQIKDCEMNDRYISFSASMNYMIPRKSMKEEEFVLLSNTLKERIKNS